METRRAIRDSGPRLGNFEGKPVRIWGGLRVRLDHVSLEGAADAVAGGVFEDRQRHELIRTGLPGCARSPEPASVVRLDAHLPLDEATAPQLDAQRPAEKAVVERLGKDHDQRLDGARPRGTIRHVAGASGRASAGPTRNRRW